MGKMAYPFTLTIRLITVEIPEHSAEQQRYKIITQVIKTFAVIRGLKCVYFNTALNSSYIDRHFIT